MQIKRVFTLLIALSFFTTPNAQENNNANDSLMVRKIFDEALENGRAYADLRSLCKDIGARLSGSISAEMAVQWGYHRLNKYDFDTVYFQEVIVPHWERGTKESGYYQSKDGTITKVNLLALGG